jgi:hypothetical protein
VQREPDGYAQIAGPWLVRQRPCGGECRRDGAGCGVKHRQRRVALAHRLQQPPTVLRSAVGDHLVMTDERLGHRGRLGLPHRGRPLDVRHAERDHAGRKRLGPAGPQALDQLARRGRPARRVGGETQTQRSLELLGAVGIDPGPRRQNTGRRGPGEQRKRGRGQREHVAGPRRGTAGGQLRRPEAWRAGTTAQRARRRGQTEVNELDPATLGQDQVRGLDVAVDDRRVLHV